MHENVVQNLFTEKSQQCPVYASLLLKFVKLVLFLKHQDVSVALYSTYTWKYWNCKQYQLDIVLKNGTLHVLVYVAFLVRFEKQIIFSDELIFILLYTLISKIAVLGAMESNACITSDSLARLVERNHHWFIFL